LSGIYTALMEAPTEQIIVMACDMPFLMAPFLKHLAARPAELTPFDPDGRLLVNINTPDDCTRALEAVEPPPRIA
jgi:molybdopterin-guanine dinucleotide biosynthesis protein A